MNPFEHLHTEKAIIACLLQNPDLIIDLDGTVSLDHFKSPVNRELVDALVNLYSSGYTGFNTDMVFNRISISPIQGLPLDQLRMYIESLFQADAFAQDFKTYLDDLSDVEAKYRLNKILHTFIEKLVREGETLPASDVVADLQTELFSLEGRFNSKTDEPQDLCCGIKDRILDRVSNPNQYTGIPSGISIIDELTLGWLDTKFYFVAARPKTGKSALLSQFAHHAAFFAPKKRSKVLYLDTEIKPAEYDCRMVGSIAAVDNLRLLAGDWYHNQKASENIMQTLDFLEANRGNFFHKYIAGFKISNIVALIKKYVYNYGVGMVVFDYIKEPKDTGDKARWQKIGDLARALKETAGELDIPVLSALQQNRKGEGQSRTGGESYGESDDVLKECDGAFMLNWKSPKEIEAETLTAGTHRLQLERARYTRSLYSGINLRFYGYCLRFVASSIQATEDPMHQAMEQDYNDTEVLPLPTATEEIRPLAISS